MLAIRHDVRLERPFYERDAAHCGLHRYLDADFVNHFRQDIERRRFGDPQFREWQNHDRTSRLGREPVLRLPIHRAFHLVSCEVACDRLGTPALDPRRIASAGFVVRKLGGAREQAWMMEDGQPIGWHDAPGELRDPDLHRRLCANGVLHARTPEPAYSGEDVHPLHVMKTVDAAGKTHTILYGYLPLGGFYYHRGSVDAVAESPEAVIEAAQELLPWPFGFRGSRVQTWHLADAKPVHDGRPTKPFFELLRLLVSRYHLGEAGLEANSALEAQLSGISFYDEANMPHALRGFGDATRAAFAPYRRFDLMSYLRECFAAGADNPLVRWVVEQEKEIDRAGGIERVATFAHLPASAGGGTLGLSLFMLSSDAQEIRALLDQRLREQTLERVREIPLPKFTQGANDLYQIVPFVRSRNEAGQEQIDWADAGARSIKFRVAAPFDPEASRPSLIQMPSLADLKRGLAKGAMMLTPPDTFDVVNSLKFGKGVSPDAIPENPPPGLGLQWICSFSLPVVTLIAMILLMIMVILLNLIFFWLPWVQICIPFPKMK